MPDKDRQIYFASEFSQGVSGFVPDKNKQNRHDGLCRDASAVHLSCKFVLLPYRKKFLRGTM